MKEANFIKYEVAREDGHRFYFRAAYYGLWCFVAAVVLFLLLKSLKDYFSCLHFLDAIQEYIVGNFSPMLKEQKQARGQINFTIICLFSIPIGRFTPLLVNKAMRKKSAEALIEAAVKDELEGLLVDAINNGKMISVTMSSGKVYAGQPIGTAEPRSTRKAIAMLPLVSGYREANGKLIFTTHYDQIFKEAKDAGDYRLILPSDKIVSAAFFDAEVYEKFNAVKTNDDEPSVSEKSAILGLGALVAVAIAERLGSALVKKIQDKKF